MSNTYAIADLHIGHPGILRYRTGFFHAYHHDSTILYNIQRTCGKRDTLYLLGDCFFTMDSLGLLRKIRKAVGRLHMVLGNHDTESPLRQRVLAQILKEGLVDSIHGLFKYKGAWLSHAPIHPDELRGAVCVHGHMHDRVVDDLRYVNVSCERTGYEPVNLKTIIDKAKEYGYR